MDLQTINVSWNLIFEYYSNTWKKIQFLLKCDKDNGTLHEDVCALMAVHRRILRNVSDKCCRKTKEHVFCSIIFFWNIVPFMRKCGKIFYSRKGHRWQYNRAHSLCILDKKMLQAHTQNMWYFLLFHCHNDYAIASYCYVLRKLSLLFVSLCKDNCYIYLLTLSLLLGLKFWRTMKITVCWCVT